MNISLALLMKLTGISLDGFIVETTMMTRTLTAYWPGLFWFTRKIVFSEAELVAKLKYWASYHHYCHISTRIITLPDSDAISHYEFTLKIPTYFENLERLPITFTNEDEIQGIIDVCEYIRKEAYKRSI